MEYLIGVGIAAVVCAFATLVGFDRDRVFYPTLVTVIATYYILFAVPRRRWPWSAWWQALFSRWRWQASRRIYG